MIVDSLRHSRAQDQNHSGPPAALTPRTSQGVHDGEASQPRPKVPKRPTSDNLDPGILTALLYDDLVEVEALATTADSMVSQLPPMPQGKYGRILARLYTLVGATATRTAEALDRGEDLVAVRKA